jgi:hypothetical protein
MLSCIVVIAMIEAVSGDPPHATLIWGSQPTFPGETVQLWGGGLSGDGLKPLQRSMVWPPLSSTSQNLPQSSHLRQHSPMGCIR